MGAEWEPILKLWGPLGLIVLGLAFFIWKYLLPALEKQRAEYKAALDSALEDARRERDYARLQREKEVDKFLESLRYRDEQFKSVADAIAERRPPRQR
jgi:F0F1-type ATP synthase membrane subunit b/b'